MGVGISWKETELKLMSLPTHRVSMYIKLDLNYSMGPFSMNGLLHGAWIQWTGISFLFFFSFFVFSRSALLCITSYLNHELLGVSYSPFYISLCSLINLFPMSH